jgi:phosphoglycerate dehydrogenase-like enzyme
MTSTPTAHPARRARTSHAAAGLLTLLAATSAGAAEPAALPDADTLIRDLGLIESSTPVREHKGWQPPRKVVVLAAAPGAAEAMQSVVPRAKVVAVTNAAEAVREARDADVVMGICSKDVLAAGPQIRWIQVYGAGVENCVSIPAMRSRDVLLTNMQRIAAPVMAEHVLAMMLSFARGLQFYIPERMEARWSEELPAGERMLTLQGKTLLVVGLGGIGTEVAKRAHALGMNVVATRASGRDGPDFVSYVGLPAELRQLAGKADFIVNTVPLTAQTTAMFDAKFFAGARKGAYFFNVGRGASVVQDDLVAALRSGQIAGAGLDVTDPEPLPADHPLWTFRNVIITPHVATASDLGPGSRIAIARENLRRYAAGEPLLSVVDLVKGY